MSLHSTRSSSSADRSGPRAAGGRGLLGKSVRVVLQGHNAGQRPGPPVLPSLAVLGRSNVGKSSLLNALLDVPVARVSQTPGRTQALYWYRVDERFDLVDCPGYGYAKVAKQDREKFAGLIEELLSVEPRPAVALLLVDGRLSPQESDRSMALFLRTSGVPTIVAATKWDAVKPSERVRRRRELAAEYEDPTRPLLPVSAETGENLRELASRVVAAVSGAAHAPSGPKAPPSGSSAKER